MATLIKSQISKVHVPRVRFGLRYLGLFAATLSFVFTPGLVFGSGAITWDELLDTRAMKRDALEHVFVAQAPANTALFQDSYLKPRLDTENRKEVLESPDESLIRWSKSLKIERPREYERGVYGKVGTATIYITHISRIPDFDRLHWVIVKVLSEKYGCFIVHKLSSSQLVSVRCRDKRRIVFRRSRGDDWIMFYARQYDHRGHEIIIGH